MVIKPFAVQVFTMIVLVDVGIAAKKPNIALPCALILHFNSGLP